jgi:UDP-glucose 4-epimerase
MKKSDSILVTGGAGFIGSHLVDHLIKKGYKNISVIDDLSGGFKRNLNTHATFFKCDLRNVKKTAEIIEKIKPILVYHLAANAAENKAQFSPIDITSRNYNAFLNTLVPALRNGMKRIVVTSSIAVYGAIKPPFKETDRPEPEDLYGLSKLQMEETLKILSRVHNFEYVITRPHNVYGPRQNMTDPYRNVITIFMNALLRGQAYFIYGDGTQRRCFSYIDEVVQALMKCGLKDVAGKIFNIGADKDYSLNELSDMIQKVSGVHIPPLHISDRPQEVKVAISDHTLAKNVLEYKDSTSLENGLLATWKYAKKCGYQKPKYTEVELENEKMPANWLRSDRSRRKR